jgi:hypothetical protein
MKKLKSLFTLKSIGLVLFAALALLLTNYADASTPESAETVVTATMGLGALKTDVWERGYNFIDWLIGENEAGRRNDFESQFLQDLKQGKKSVNAFSYYIRKLVGKDGKVKLIESADKNVEGITNMGEGLLGKGSFLSLTDIFVAYASSESVDDKPDMVVYTNHIYDNTTKYVAGTVDLNSTETGNQFMPVAAQAIPTKLINAELTIKNGNDVIIPQMLLSDLLVNNRSGVAMPGNGALALRVPKLISGELITTAEIQYPKNGTITASYNFIEMKLIGISITNK